MVFVSMWLKDLAITRVLVPEWQMLMFLSCPGPAKRTTLPVRICAVLVWSWAWKVVDLHKSTGSRTAATHSSERKTFEIFEARCESILLCTCAGRPGTFAMQVSRPSDHVILWYCTRSTKKLCAHSFPSCLSCMTCILWKAALAYPDRHT